MGSHDHRVTKGALRTRLLTLHHVEVQHRREGCLPCGERKAMSDGSFIMHASRGDPEGNDRLKHPSIFGESGLKCLRCVGPLKAYA